MTAEMLDLARANQAKAGVTNAEFLEGRIEAVPLPERSVDVVVSSCVINRSADKDAVFAEVHRVLRPGGRLAVADVIADREPDPELLADDAAGAGCIAGAVTRDRYGPSSKAPGSPLSRSSTATRWPTASGRCSSGAHKPGRVLEP